LELETMMKVSQVISGETLRRFWRSIASFLLACIGLALLTFVCFQIRATLAVTALLFLVAIVLISLQGRFVLALLSSVVALLCLDCFFVPPIFTFVWTQPEDFAALLTFLTTALVTTTLVSRMRRSLKENQGLRDELRLAIDTIPDMIWSALPDGSIDFVSQRWVEYTGVSLEDGLEEALHPEDAAKREEWRVSNGDRMFRTGEPFETELRFRRPDGEYRWVMNRAVPLRDKQGKITKWYGISVDIEDRKRGEEALRASEERLQDIIDNTTAVIFVKDLELRYLLVNREFERRHRVRRDEIRGQSDFDIHSREVAEAMRANDLRVIEAGEPSQFEELVLTADGKRVCLAVKFLLRDRSGKPYAVCGIATDITDLKRAEELEAQFLEEKTRVAGEIHDSLAQSFTGITMQLEMAKELMTDKDNVALSYVERADDLARFGLAEARRSVFSQQPTIIKDAGLIESLQRLAERSNIPGRLSCTFRSNLADDTRPPVEFRQDLLRIAQEAISNALRHAKSTAINVSLRSDSRNLILKVEDNSRGLTTEAEAREGFGFVNMRARVKRLNGTLDIRVAPGRGTSIVVCVPVSGSQSAVSG
jgi:PAS domain S-box-containing protein